MQHDVRRSDPTEAESEPAPKVGFARSLFRLGAKKKDSKASAKEQAQLQNRLKEVLERDRALIASEPPAPEVVELAHDDVEMHDDDAWSEQTDPFGAADPTGTRAAVTNAEPEERWPDPGAWHAVDEPFSVPAATGTRPTQRGVLQLAEARESLDLRLSQIASWIEEEINESPEGAGPVALEKPLDADELAELDAVLSTQEAPPEARTVPIEARVQPPVQVPVAEPPRAEPVEEPAAVEEPAKAEPKPRAAPSTRAQVKAKVSARPAPRDDAPSGSKEPINTLTMARLLAMQGYKPRALAVYRELLKRTPDDQALRDEYEALRKSEG